MQIIKHKFKPKAQKKEEIEPKTQLPCEHEYIYDERTAERKCQKCGLVEEERMVLQNKAPRIFGEQEKKNKQNHGPPINPLIPDIQMATYVRMDHNTTSILRRALRWDSRYKWRQRNLLHAITEIRRVSSILNIPNHVQVHASHIYRKMRRKGHLKGRTTLGMVSGCLYYALCAAEIPITIDELSETMELTPHVINQNYYLILKKLKLKSPQIDPKFYLNRYLTLLNIDSGLQLPCIKLLKLYKKVYGLSGKDPKGIAAACLYLASKLSGERKTQTEIVHMVISRGILF